MAKQTWNIKGIDEQTAEIRLYGYIGSEEVNAAAFMNELKMLETKYTKCNLRINSGGGSVFEGLTIFNGIRNSSMEFHAYVDGLAASMASVIILACDKIYMSKVAMLMTHRPSGAAMGNPDQLRTTAEMLESLEESICTIYSERTKLTKEQVKQKYLAATDNWMNAAEAKELGLIDGIYDAPKPAALPPATMRTERDLVDYFTNSFNQSTIMEKIALTPVVMAALGVEATAAADEINNAIASVVAKAGQVDAVTLQLNQEKQKNADLQGKLDAIEATKQDVAIAQLVDGAIEAKKIVATDKEKYVRLAKADFEGTKDILDNMKAFTGLHAEMKDADAATREELGKLAAMSAHDLWKQGKFERLKELSTEVYNAKYKEFTGKK